MQLDRNRAAKEIEYWPLSKLRPFDLNPKQHPPEQIRNIVESINFFGWTNPILVHSKFGIVAGHGRYMAAMEMQIEEVPVLLLDYLTVDQAKAYLLRDNKDTMDTGFDEEKLTLILVQLEEAQIDLKFTGFSDDELLDLLNPEPLSMDDGSNNYSDDSVNIAIGDLRFTVTKLQYDKWYKSITKTATDKDSMITEIRKRLKV